MCAYSNFIFLRTVIVKSMMIFYSKYDKIFLRRCIFLKTALTGYLRSFRKSQETPKNLRICEPFESECLRFVALAEAYEDKINELILSAEKSVVRKEYAVRGEGLHRGYYHPSPIFDVVVGRCNRGNLLKRITKRSKITYEYGFDESNKLVLVKTFNELSNSSNEVIIYRDNLAFGLSFSNEGRIDYLCEEVYTDGKLTELTHAIYYDWKKGISSLHKETYKYDSSGLKTADMYIYTSDILLLEHSQFNFAHDDHGFLSKYTCIDFKGDAPESTNEYDVYIKRKV